ncbi:MAG: hypothetical protein M1548_02985 [Actinobacteria bacterium]|nr:hypothetical protein [Actinomycetota bacterium]
MVEGGGVWIDEVRHKAFIEVDEQGTEVAAATSVAVKQWSAMPSEFYMLVDHPFFFAITTKPA